MTAHATASGRARTRVTRGPAEVFWGIVVRAMTAPATTFDGSPIAATITADAFTGAYTVAYRAADRPVGTRTFTIDERLRRISQLTFELDKYERRRGHATMLAIHEHLLAALAGSAAVVTGIVSRDDSRAWADWYDWAPDRAPHNAAAVGAAVEAVAAATRGQSVWDAADLAARVRAIAGPTTDTWPALIARCSPGDLLGGLDEIQPGLGGAVFGQMPLWYGERHVD